MIEIEVAIILFLIRTADYLSLEYPALIPPNEGLWKMRVIISYEVKERLLQLLLVHVGYKGNQMKVANAVFPDATRLFLGRGPTRLSCSSTDDENR